ncbi:MAG: metallophosphoesterase [Methanobacteriota archaeon]|nr:MAG: metallophosphoesterase [Euryarchaeota archaeon]
MAQENPVPVYGEKALKLGETLVLSDLHIGMEQELGAKGVSIPSQTKNMERRILSLIKRTGAEELVLLGDVKHNIPSLSIQEYREIPLFLKRLSEEAAVTVVKGNHDGNLEKIAPETPVLDSLEREGALLTHGHGWIKAGRIDADVVVMGHCHPAVAFVDEFSRTSKEPVWIRAQFNEGIKEHYAVEEPPELIVMPAFNDLIGGVAFNRGLEGQPIGPYFKSRMVDLEDARAYLLDGTDLGTLSDLEAAHKKTD